MHVYVYICVYIYIYIHITEDRPDVAQEQKSGRRVQHGCFSNEDPAKSGSVSERILVHRPGWFFLVEGSLRVKVSFWRLFILV